MTNSSENTDSKRVSLIAFAAILVAFLALPITGGLSFAESVTAFLVGEGPVAAIKHSAQFATTSPFYYVLVALITENFGHEELVLRAISMIASVATLTVLHSLVSKFLTPLASLLGLTILTFSGSFLAVTYSAEPFALGLMFLTIAIRLWIVVLQKRSALVIAGHLLATVLAIFSSYLVAVPILALHLILWFIWPAAQRSMAAQRIDQPAQRLKPRAALFYLSCIVVIISPALIHIAELLARPELQTNAEPLYGYDSREIASLISVAVLLGCTLAIKWRVKISSDPGVKQDSYENGLPLLALGLTWWIVTTAQSLLGGPVFSHGLTTHGLAFIGLAIASTAIIANCKDSLKITALAAALSLAISVLVEQPQESWKEAAALLSKEHASTVLLLSGAPEAEYAPFYRHKDAGKYLSAPFLYYPVSQIVIPAGRSNFADSVTAETYDGLIVYRRFRPSIDSSWLPHTDIDTGFQEPKIVRFLQPE